MRRAPRQQKMKRENSMKESENETSIPLNLSEYARALEFLKQHSYEFRSSFVEKIKTTASDIISSLRTGRDGYGICKPLKSNPQSFTKESLKKCKEHCFRKNEEFVEALNGNILQLINHVFCNRSLYDVLLTAVNDNIENCVYFKNGNSECKCKVKFKFTVSKELNNLLNLVLKRYENKNVHSNYCLSEQQISLIAAIVSIKLQPRFARYFIPWLIQQLDTCTELPIPVDLREEHYQPSSPQPYRNQDLYITSYQYNLPSNYMSSPHLQEISRSNDPPGDDSSYNDYSFESSTSSSHYRRRPTYYTSNSSDNAITEENDDAGAGYVEYNGGVVGETDCSFDMNLWNDLPQLFTCNCTSDKCNFNFHCLTDIDCSCFRDIFNEECFKRTLRTIAKGVCNCIVILIQVVIEYGIELILNLL